VRLAEVVATVRYRPGQKPGWEVSLHTMHGIPHLWVKATVLDSNPPHEPTTIDHVLPVPAVLWDPRAFLADDREFLRRWVYDQLLAVERHELGENLWFGDERPFLPSHDGAPDRYDEPPR